MLPDASLIDEMTFPVIHWQSIGEQRLVPLGPASADGKILAWDIKRKKFREVYANILLQMADVAEQQEENLRATVFDEYFKFNHRVKYGTHSTEDLRTVLERCNEVLAPFAPVDFVLERMGVTPCVKCGICVNVMDGTCPLCRDGPARPVTGRSAPTCTSGAAFCLRGAHATRGP
jgi:hypothetical protein